MMSSSSSRPSTPTATGVVPETSPSNFTSPPSPKISNNVGISEHQKNNQSSPEEALESHEVLELNAFIERKAWIEEKIQFLEKLPPIEVFAGMEDIQKPMEQISGLATRAQLDEWLAEHDRIEKETEMFDSGDLKKLKKLTKACTQRNLSPEDTDLIELTLTTLYALDKLLHLLRDRSENLDLLHLRLSWEEHRAQAYSTRQCIVDELNAFLTLRARWNSRVYTGPVASSITKSTIFKPRSMSTASIDSTDSPELHSRGLRFKIQEELSRDAVQLSSKITSLKHGSVTTMGKLLDKLIENSRNPVPESMLDEQDRVEEICANELDTVGRFLMVVMTQWKKADEIYNETKKDISVLRRLREELENANFQQPLKRMETNYSSRLDTVAKRIAARTNPVSPRGTFPLPAHPLFPDQADFNATLVKSLSVELNEVTDLLNDVNAAVESYRSRCKAIDDAVQLREEIACTLLQISVLRDRLENGFHSDDGDGSPPDLSLTECVEPLRSSSYLARLPSLTEEIAKLEADTHTLLGKYAVATLRLQSAEIDEVPKEELAADMTRLDSELKGLVHGRDVMLSNVTKLRDIRRIWSTLTDLTSQVEALTAQTHEAIGRERWKQHFTREELPPTPEGSQLDLPVHDDVPSATMDTLDSLYGVYFAECEGPFERMHGSLPQKLSQHLEIKLGGFREAFSDLKDMCVLLVGVRRQAASMASIRDDTHKLLAKVDELRSLAEELSRDILQGAGTDVLAWEQSFDESLSALDKEVKALTGSLSARVILLTKEQHSNTTDSRAIASKLPFNPVLQDRIVRHDANTFATSLNGGIRDLQRRQQYVHACSLARVVDLAIERVEAEIASANPAIDTYRKRLKDIYSSSEASTPSSLQELKDDIDSAVGSSFRIEEALKTACAELSQLLDDTKDIADDACQQLATSRSSSLERVKERHKQSKSAMETIQAEFNSFELSLARIAAERSTTSFVQERSGCIDDVESDCGIGDDTLVQEAPAEDETDLVEVNVLDGLQKDNGSTDRVVEISEAATSSSSSSVPSHETILSRIQGIRHSLKLLALETYCNQQTFGHRGQMPLPTASVFDHLNLAFSNIESEIVSLPSTSSSQDVIRELAKLKLAVDIARTQLKRIENLALLSTSVSACDAAFSELLNHIDSYPSLPEGSESSPTSMLPEFPEELLSTRLAATKNAISDVSEQYAVVADDSRASTEYSRLMQTWEELSDMAMDRINGRSMSRQAGSSGRSSRTSTKSAQPTNAKRGKYGTLTQGAKTLLPPVMQRRTVSNSSSNQGPGKQPQRVSRSTSNRSVSGPIAQSTSASSLFKSTFASRQRTTSTTSNMSPGSSKVPSTSSTRDRRGSLTSSPVDHSTVISARSTNSRGTWSRAPRQSFSFERPQTPQNKPTQVQKKRYVANPSNKLDVAVGDVVNSLPVNIDIEVVADTWKDQSGKYWIGGEDPKLCFCRILRSQTVMVRVGGGWAELSKFIQGHFADLFRLLPESPPQAGSREAKWINASTLREAAEIERLRSISPRTPAPRTPEPTVSSLPSFAFSSPDGANTSMRSESSFGSPLTPLQFIRRAGNEPSEISFSAHSRASSVRPSRKSSLGMSSKPAKLGVWRP